MTDTKYQDLYHRIEKDPSGNDMYRLARYKETKKGLKLYDATGYVPKELVLAAAERTAAIQVLFGGEALVGDDA